MSLSNLFFGGFVRGGLLGEGKEGRLTILFGGFGGRCSRFGGGAF